MAARHLPMIDTPQTLTIDSTFTPSQQALIMPTEQTVNFFNNSGQTISIQFEPNPPGPTLFTNVASLTTGSTSGQVPRATNGNGAVNYYIIDASGTQHGPYSIQVGNGPLYIQVTYNSATGQGVCVPDPIAIGVGGYLEMIGDNNYSVAWPTSFGDPFSPPLNAIGIGSPNNSPHQSTGSPANYAYTVTKAGIQGTGGGGGGKVIVKSS